MADLGGSGFEKRRIGRTLDRGPLYPKFQTELQARGCSSTFYTHILSLQTLDDIGVRDSPVTSRQPLLSVILPIRCKIAAVALIR